MQQKRELSGANGWIAVAGSHSNQRRFAGVAAGGLATLRDIKPAGLLNGGKHCLAFCFLFLFDT